MSEFVFYLAGLVLGYMFGVWSTADTLRMYDNDLYCEWMRRRKERRRQK